MITKEIEYQSQHLLWLDEALKVPFHVKDDSYHAIGCFDIALEHFAAMLLLSSNELYGPTLALTRVTFEAVGRGLWLRHCATPAHREKFSKGKLELSFADLLQQVEAAVGSTEGPLSSLKTGSWTIMNDYTHTGIRQVMARHAKTTVAGTYAPEVIVGALRIGGVLALLAAGELASLAGNEELVRSVQQRAKLYGRPWASP
jgi:hypothetical protein